MFANIEEMSSFSVSTTSCVQTPRRSYGDIATAWPSFWRSKKKMRNGPLLRRLSTFVDAVRDTDRGHFYTFFRPTPTKKKFKMADIRFFEKNSIIFFKYFLSTLTHQNFTTGGPRRPLPRLQTAKDSDENWVFGEFCFESPKSFGMPNLGALALGTHELNFRSGCIRGH